MSWIVGCDTGGTFTDVFARQRLGRVRGSRRCPSTPPRFDLGRRRGRARSSASRPADVRTRLPRDDRHDERGDHQDAARRSALVTTEGFRDILEIRRANREELYDILWDPPAPLVPRRHRLEVVERVDYAGDGRHAARRGHRCGRRPARSARGTRVRRRLPDQRAHEPSARAAGPRAPPGGRAPDLTSRSRRTSCRSRPSSSGRRRPSPTPTARPSCAATWTRSRAALREDGLRRATSSSSCTTAAAR